jgi:tetratricopeptide (TPR) repeat protein
VLSRSRLLRVCLLLIGALLCACSRDHSAARKLAVLPFENLSGARDLDWVGLGLAEVVTAQLTGTPDIDPAVAPSQREAELSGSSGILRGYYSLVGGRLRVEAVLENTATRRSAASASAVGSPDGILALAGAIARQLDSHARPFSTANQAALRAYVEALTGRDSPQAFERAVAADPAFGAAYVAWAQWLISRAERDRARRVVAASRELGTRIPEVERARLEVLSAELDGDRPAQRRALAFLARATPADASVFQKLGAMDLSARAYQPAVQWYEKALEREPASVALLNEAGYAQAYARDLEAAVKSLSRYRELRPLQANPLDSLGDVNFLLGQFSRAGKYYLEAYAREPSFLMGGETYKAAWARLLAGDLKGADETFAKYLQARQGFRDPLVPYRQAQWEYLTGRRSQAIARLDRVAQEPQPALASLAVAQLSIWMLETGNPARARQYALRTAPSSSLSTVCRFLTEPLASASEWAARAERAFQGPSEAWLKHYALASALLLSKSFPEAAVQLTKLSGETPPGSQDPVDVLLAWALVETGSFKQAEDLLALTPLPDPVREHPLLSLSFPRVLFLRAVVQEKLGRRDQAKANYELFLQLSGDLPMIFGEESRAREALK